MWYIFLATFFLGASLFGIEFRQASQVSESRQHLLAPCFSEMDSLYLQSSSSTFIGVGRDVNLAESIYPGDQRGFSPRTFRSFPAKLRTNKLFQISGTSVLLFEMKPIGMAYAHFFHFLESLLGIWNFGGDKYQGDVGLFLLVGNGDKGPLPGWKGKNEITYHLIRALFPNAEIKIWGDFLSDCAGRLICFDRAIISDRCMAIFKREPYKTERMLGEYFQYLNPDTLNRLTVAVHKYMHAERKHNSKKVITYSYRKCPPRCLDECFENELLEKIRSLPDVDLQIADFNNLSFSEQVALDANTDILIGAHGNGLSHILLAPSGATLIEFFPRDVLRVDYRIIAQARRLSYFGFCAGRGVVDDEEAQKGVYGPDAALNVAIGEGIDVDAVIEVIKKAKKAV